MKIVKLPFFPKNWAMSFVGVIWCGDKSWIGEHTINHETIHLQQQKEMLFLPFYVADVLEWLYKSLRYRSFFRGYLNISHEREAYLHEKDLHYLETRRPFAEFKKENRRKITINRAK